MIYYRSSEATRQVVILKFIMAILSNSILRIDIDIIRILPDVSRCDNQILRLRLSDSMLSLHDPIVMNLEDCRKPEVVGDSC